MSRGASVMKENMCHDDTGPTLDVDEASAVRAGLPWLRTTTARVDPETADFHRARGVYEAGSPDAYAVPPPARKPRLLDLFCGAGGASMGYHRAGFEVVGVDIVDQPDYPFEFHRMDVMDLLTDSEAGEAPSWALFTDAIHASPPCQPYSKAVTSRSSKWNDTRGKDEPALIGMVRNLIPRGMPYVIENVRDAYPYLIGPIELCGTMFGLPIPRHRLFETSWVLHAFDVPRHPKCKGVAKGYALARGWDYRDMTVTGKGRRAGTSERWSEIMGIDWHMTQHQLKEAIPPAYTEWIGRQLLQALERAAA